MKGIIFSALFIVCIMLELSQLIQAEDNIYDTEYQRFLIEPLQKFNWFQADAKCKLRNMQLVTLDTEAKVQRLRGVLKKEYLDKNKKIPRLYIGGNDLGEYRKHIWSKTGISFSYANWEKSEPNNYHQLNERCVHLGFHGDDKWNDINCEQKYGYICEVSRHDDEFARLARSMNFA